MPDEFDLVVIGGGPGGYAAALYGASAGLRVGLVEEERVGGTCLHRGCIPAKALLETAAVARTVRRAAEFGVRAGSEVAVDLVAGHERKQRIVERLATGLESLVAKRDVAVFPGRGRLVGPGRVEVSGPGSPLVLAGRGVVLATGSAARGIDRPGLAFDGERVLSSDDVLRLDEVPGRVAVIGGGAIGCEFASLLADLGSSVTVLEAMPRVLPGVDEQVARELGRAFGKRGVRVRSAVEVLEAEHRDGAVTLRFAAGSGEPVDELEVDAVIVSVGRSPRSSDLGLEEAGVALTPGGHVVVDGTMATGVAGVYAVGDLVPTPQLAHVAFAEAMVAVRAILGEAPSPVDYDRVPWGIYSHPEVAFCGLTEAAARERGHEVETSTHRFLGNGRALIVGETDGLVKVVARKDGPVLGVHIVGPWATELLGQAYLAVNWEATPGELGRLVQAHPTLSETLGEAALALTGRSLHG